MGLLKAILNVNVEKKSYYAGRVPHLPYFMRPRTGSNREYEVVERATGRIHGTYNQRGVASQITNTLNGVKNT